MHLDQRRSTDYGALFAENVFRWGKWYLVPSARFERENVIVDASVHTGHSVLVDRLVDHTVTLFGLGFGNDFGHANET